MKVALIVITDGRWDYLLDTMESANNALDCDFAQKLLIDDSGFGGSTPEFDGFTTVKHTERQGLVGAIQSAWDHVDPSIDYIFHLEDDFVFLERIDVMHMISYLEKNPRLAQMALMRQAWSPEERLAGGIYRMHPHDYTVKIGYYEHKRLFTFNPCVYPKIITEYGAGTESELTEQLLKMEYKFAYYGQPEDQPRAFHIGIRRSIGYKV